MVTQQDVRNLTKQKLLWLTKQHESSEQRAILAQLRHGVTKAPGEDPKLWEVLFQDMPVDMYGCWGEPSYAEWAVYTALTMYAIHQQSKDIKTLCMYQSTTDKYNNNLAAAVARLVDDFDSIERIRSKLYRVLGSYDIRDMNGSLRHIIEMLNKESIPVDYANLAGDLYMFQFQEIRPSVSLRWGQDFSRGILAINNSKEGDKNYDN